MSDETWNHPVSGPQADAAGGSETGERVAFCQDCGTSLTQATVRTVGTGVFCEPCLATRVGVPAGTASQGPTGYGPTAYGAPLPPAAPIDAHPLLAGLLGFIPGVGAMYNGQYAKGVAHVVIFIVLSSLANHVDIFGLLVAGWVFYQVFDAYHTAKARLEGRPLPNPFGLNEIGERMGFGHGWGSAARATAPSNASPAAGAAPPQSTPYTPPVTRGPDWVGYVPPTQFASAPPPVGPPPPAWTPAPYAETYTGAAPFGTATPAVAPRRFPVGALWLVGLGLLFLLFEFTPEWGLDWQFSGRWLVPVIFAGLAVWTSARRIALGFRSIRALRASIFLMTLAVLFALQAADWLSLRHTWPVLLIVLGALMIAERTEMGNFAFGAPPAVSTSVVPPTATDPEVEAARTRAAWSGASTPEAPLHTPNDTTKDSF